MVAEELTRLRVEFRDTGQRMTVDDSWMAATARSKGIPVATRDSDHVQISALNVIIV